MFLVTYFRTKFRAIDEIFLLFLLVPCCIFRRTEISEGIQRDFLLGNLFSVKLLDPDKLVFSSEPIGTIKKC